MACSARGCVTTCATPPQLICKIRLLCKDRGVTGFRDLGDIFCALVGQPQDGLGRTGQAGIGWFKSALVNFGLMASDVELENLYNFCGGGKSAAEKLMQCVRQPMSADRVNMIESVFNILDGNKDGCIQLCDILAMYNIAKNPRFLNGDWSEEDVLRNFIHSFKPDMTPETMVSRKEFFDYYAGVGMFIEQDIHFDYMMRSNWKI